MRKPPTFHSFIWLNTFRQRLDQTPMMLRVLALLFLLVVAMLIEAAKTMTRRRR